MLAGNLPHARLAQRRGGTVAPGEMGDDILVTCDCTGEGRYEVFAGIRSPYLRLPGKPHSDRSCGAQNDWCRAAGAAGTVRLGGKGVLRNTEIRRRLSAARGRAFRWRLHIPQAGTLEGPFEVTVLRAAGEAGENWEFELGSLGPLSFCPR